MHSPHHCGNPVTHARWRRNHDEWVETFTVFLTAFLTLTRVHLLPPRSHKLFLCLGHADHLGIEWELQFKATHTQRLPLQFLSLPTALLLVLADKRRISSQWLCFSLLLTLPTSFQENEKPTKMKSRIRSSGWFLIKADRWGPTNSTWSLPSPLPRSFLVLIQLFGKLAFWSKRSQI